MGKPSDDSKPYTWVDYLLKKPQGLLATDRKVFTICVIAPPP